MDTTTKQVQIIFLSCSMQVSTNLIVFGITLRESGTATGWSVPPWPRLCLGNMEYGMKSCPNWPRTIPLVEREERQANQIKRLKGLDCEGENEPSHGLIDRVFARFSKSQLSRIDWKD